MHPTDIYTSLKCQRPTGMLDILTPSAFLIGLVTTYNLSIPDTKVVGQLIVRYQWTSQRDAKNKKRQDPWKYGAALLGLKEGGERRRSPRLKTWLETNGTCLWTWA